MGEMNMMIRPDPQVFELLEKLSNELDKTDALVKELHSKGTTPNAFDKMKYKKQQAKLIELRNQVKTFIKVSNDVPF